MSESGAGASESTGTDAPVPDVQDGGSGDVDAFTGAETSGPVEAGEPGSAEAAPPGTGPFGAAPDGRAGSAVSEPAVVGVSESAASGEADASEPAPAAPDAPEPGEPEAAAVGDAPDLGDDADLDAALEALLLVVDVPAGEELLADTLQQPVARIRTALERLAEGYTQARRGIDLRAVGDGWRFYTRETYAPYVERYLLDGQRAKLTRAALETLAVVAYRQPVSRARVAAVRGVNVDGVIRTLVGRGLVEEAGTDPSTGGFLYCTTELFLERLGLSSLKDLPPLAPLLPEVDAIDDV